MSGEIGVAVGTYGDLEVWQPLVMRAIASVESQTQRCRLRWIHEDELHIARNIAADQLAAAGCEWLIFLDADDELDEDFILRMALWASLSKDEHKYPIYQPSVLGVIDGVPENFPYIQPKPAFDRMHGGGLLTQNYLTIGCMHKAEMFTEIGGFDDWPMVEDWAYWLKAWVHGAVVVQNPDAIYKAYIDADRPGRNTVQSIEVEVETCMAIRALYRAQAKETGVLP